MNVKQDQKSRLELLTKEKEHADERINGLIEELGISQKEAGVRIAKIFIIVYCNLHRPILTG